MAEALFARRDARRRRRPWGLPLLVEVGRRTAWLQGDRVQDLLDRAQVGARQWDHRRRCWMVNVNRADDVITVAEHTQGRVVTIRAVER